ncbi:hypothetical protein BpHYR1_004497 [Brachionus plicatilis]|uniref:Uncharacterized protein n=1 Tax=Brachionus plicatilis TaxID=10195 RepID=A0A3M7T8V2_BRAPC|nr:hypothetical protein BpHYR1_004497 [Brachionus plicatilis]
MKKNKLKPDVFNKSKQNKSLIENYSFSPRKKRNNDCLQIILPKDEAKFQWKHRVFNKFNA